MKDKEIADKSRCLELRKKSKRGAYLSHTEREFCENMFNKYLEWYGETEEEVFNDTVPFGSGAKYKD